MKNLMTGRGNQGSEGFEHEHMLVTRAILNELSFVTLASHVRNSELGGTKDVEKRNSYRKTYRLAIVFHT